MFHGDKEAFSLRDEMCTCSNIEEEIDVVNKTIFIIIPYHKGGGQTDIGQGNEKTV